MKKVSLDLQKLFGKKDMVPAIIPVGADIIRPQGGMANAIAAILPVVAIFGATPKAGMTAG